MEIKEHFSVHLTSQTSLCMSRDMVLQSVLFSLAFYPRNLVFFLTSSLEFNSHRGQPKSIGVLVSSPIGQSFCSVLLYCRGGCIFFVHMAADIMLNMLSNTLLK